MNFDWKIILIGFNFIVLLGNIFMYCIIKFNDLKHLTKDVEELKTDNKDHKILIEKKLDQIFKRLGKIDKAIVKREAICNERHRK